MENVSTERRSPLRALNACIGALLLAFLAFNASALPLPLPPPEVDASDGIFDNRIVVNFQPGANSTSFNIYVSNTLTSPKIFYGNAARTPIVLNGFEPGVVHYVWVHGVNSTGESIDATYDTGYAAGTPTASVPAAPTLEFAVPGNRNATVYFKNNGDGSSPVTGYRATCGSRSQTGSSSPITVTNLHNNTSYSCSVIASNSVGNSAASNTKQVTPTGQPVMADRLQNISTRADVGTGDYIAIAGFIVEGSGQKCLIVRGRGPSVGAPAGVSRLPDPILTLRSGSTIIAENDNWTQQDNPFHVDIIEGFDKAPDDLLDAAIFACLDPGAYTALLRGYLGTTGVGLIEVIDVEPSHSTLYNISTRAMVRTDDLVAIAGFIISGDEPRQVLIRGRGPSVSVPSGVPRLYNPTLALKAGSNLIATNDNWQQASNSSAIVATGKAPGNSREAAILTVLQPGAYTAILRGVNGGTGVGIVELLDLTD